MLARSATKDDLVVVYLSSHGSPREKGTAGVNCVITNDTDLKDADSLFATALPMVELVDVVRTRIQARRAVIFLDTCHSGAVTAAAGAGINSSQMASPTFDRLTQGVGESSSRRAKRKKNPTRATRCRTATSPTIWCGHSGRTAASVDKFFDAVRDQVSRQVQADWKMHQTPVLSKSTQSPDIVIGVRPETLAAHSAN